MSEFQIFPNNNQEGTTEEDNGDRLYTIHGKHDFIDNSGFPRVEDADKGAYIHAKEIVLDKSKRYYVKVGKHGRLFNPIGIYSEGSEYKKSNHTGNKEWKLRKTNKKSFELYKNFLKTKNTAWLLNAEREM
tara:strand:+ start:469 stop:861 length:393 start_codon:yes stop_codon:yes gene_type:complete